MIPCALCFPDVFAETLTRDAVTLVIRSPRQATQVAQQQLFPLHEAVPVASLPLWTDGLELCKKPGLERKIRIKSISLLHSWKWPQFPGQECVRTAKCSLSQLFLEMLTGRCGLTPLPFVTQRLEELTGPVPFNSSWKCNSKEQSQGPLTVVSVMEMGVAFLGGGICIVTNVPTP